MDVVAVFDEKNYDNNWDRFKREAVRGIIIENNKIALVKSKNKGFYKFPGGGIENDESHLEALIREIQEETGLKAIPSTIKEFGLIHEIRKSIKEENTIFDQKSFYYFINVENKIYDQSLEDYEFELGYVLEWVDIRHACEINIELDKKYKRKFLLREAEILKMLIDN